MKRYVYIVLALLSLSFTAKGQEDAVKLWSDGMSYSDLIEVYKIQPLRVHFTNAPRIDFPKQRRNVQIHGSINDKDSVDDYLRSCVRLVLEIDSVWYDTNIVEGTGVDNQYYISYPEHLSRSKSIKKYLLIERVGFGRQCINIDSLRDKSILNITLQPQSAFPTIYIRRGEYHIDLSPLSSDGWKLPEPSIGFYDFYESICYLLKESGNKDMTLLLKFTKEGVLEEIKGKDEHSGITCYLNELKWKPAVLHLYYLRKPVPVEVLLNVATDGDKE